VRPLENRLVKLIESDNDRKMELCSVELETEPIEAVKVRVRPLKKELPRLRESDKILNIEMCSTKLET
jgi:hypothetical protein